MTQRIYVNNDCGELVPLEEKGFDDEDTLQRLIAEHPELLDGEQICPDDPRRWILIDREVGVADKQGSAARWSLDHLLIDQDMVPTLVEVKLRSNPEVRRAVVGQMLDYAAHAPQTWETDELRRTFERSSGDPEGALRKLLQADGKPDADAFWEGVDNNLAAQRLRLLFVSDSIPDELADTVRFLNEQMPRIEVLAVEIKQFLRDSHRMLVPQVIGRAAGSKLSASNNPRRRLDRDTLLNELSDDEADAVRRLLSVAEECGARLNWGSSSVTIRAIGPHLTKSVPVAWIYAPSASWVRQQGFNFGAHIFDPEMSDEVRSLLAEWTDQFAADGFTEDISWEGVQCRRVSYQDAVAHLDLLESRFRHLLMTVRQQ